MDTAKLLASELVTNAVRHGEGMIRLRVDLDERRLLVEVMDEGTGFQHVVRGEDLPQAGGWGLGLVESESSHWGIRPGTTNVWFELAQPSPLARDQRARELTA
jgi:anti-sigma regulatory factor (Ser/Thr protein kinase)